MAIERAPRTRAWSEERAREIVVAEAGRPGPLLLALQALQDEFGYLHEAAVGIVADVLNVSRAEVHGVITFYRDFRSIPAGERVVRVCRAESCQAMGSEELVRALEDHLGASLGETAADGSVTLEQVFCLGNCALSPAVMVDGALVGRADVARVAAALGGGGRR